MRPLRMKRKKRDDQQELVNEEPTSFNNNGPMDQNRQGTNPGKQLPYGPTAVLFINAQNAPQVLFPATIAGSLGGDQPLIFTQQPLDFGQQPLIINQPSIIQTPTAPSGEPSTSGNTPAPTSSKSDASNAASKATVTLDEDRMEHSNGSEDILSC